MQISETIKKTLIQAINEEKQGSNSFPIKVAHGGISHLIATESQEGYLIVTISFEGVDYLIYLISSK
jgi:hypothetical protein